MSEMSSTLGRLFQVRDQLAASSSVIEAIRSAVELAQSHSQSQSAAVFMLSKSGYLERRGHLGFDSNGTVIPSDWYADERYSVGDSLTGRVVVSQGPNDFGHPYLTNRLDIEELSPRSRQEYDSCLGKLQSAIGIPLNGQHRTFGVLRALNKTGANSMFDENDLFWLAHIGINLAVTISGLRRRFESELLAEIARNLVGIYDSDWKPLRMYQYVANKLVGELTHYKACIIRLYDKSSANLVQYAQGGAVDWTGRNPALSVKDSHRCPVEAWKSGRPVHLTDIGEHRDRFENLNWIEKNGLVSFACYPLFVRDSSVGTLSVFTGYRHHFADSDNRLLLNVSRLLATYNESSRTLGELAKVREQFKDMIGRASLVSGDILVQSTLHDQKHTLQSVFRQLKRAEGGSHNLRLSVIRHQLAELGRLIDATSQQMTALSSERPEAVDVNITIRDLVRTLRTDLIGTGSKITIVCELDPDVPLIDASEHEIRELAFNILNNGIKAVRAANRKDGVVRVVTRIVMQRIELIEIAVEDNGIGIRSEHFDLIFKQGYSTFEGGTGQGLYVARKIAHRYGGQLVLEESTLGTGSRFVIRLPKKRLTSDS